jgi:hypothetical protein
MASVATIKSAVRARDGHKCVDCSITAKEYWARSRKRLDVHRLTPGSKYTVEGTVTVCRRCHKRRHAKEKPSKGSRILCTVHDGGLLRAAIRYKAARLSVGNKQVTAPMLVSQILLEALAPEIRGLTKFRKKRKLVPFDSCRPKPEES